MNEPIKKNRITVIDFIRAFALFGILLVHSNGVFVTPPIQRKAF